MIGSIVYELAPSSGNPRNSEGSFGRTPDGRLLFIYSHFSGGTADHATADLAMLTSDDEGYTWKDEGILLKAADAKALNLMSVTLLTLGNGDLGLFYLIRHSSQNMYLYLRRTRDGRTWSDPVICTTQEGYYVINNDRVIRLSNGRLLAPVAYHRTGQQTDTREAYFDSAAEAFYFYSDDDGYHWSVGHKCTLPFTAYCNSGLQEPGVIEMSNGVLQGWARTELGRQFEMFSTDQGHTWTAPQPSRFTSPNSPLSMKRLPDNRIIAVWNPIPIYNGRSETVNNCWTGGRTPLVYALSDDEGHTFSEPVILENEKDHGYCYTAIYGCRKHLLLAYCAGGPEDTVCLAKLRIRLIPYNCL